MWLFTKRGFYSIVQHSEKPDILIVRARVAGDIERYWPYYAVEESSDSDYRFRAEIPRLIVAEKLKDIADQIDYSNYKDNIEDKRRSPFYARVWMEMVRLQRIIGLTRSP